MQIDMLKQLGRDIGLQSIGITRATDEVRELFPWAESVIVTAISCLPPEKPLIDDKPRGLVARFARSRDYHLIMRSKLGALLTALQGSDSGLQAEICVDTTPIPERKLAVLAGIAERGKNGNVFVNGCGSYAVLGEIVLDRQYNLDEAPVDMHFTGCADCSRCMTSCPTSAITAPGVVESSRCISQLTQIGGIIPYGFRGAIGNRLYGCDICQEVCPRNSSLAPCSPDFTEDTFPGADPEIIPLINLDPADFKNKVKDSSIGWIRRTRIRRNAIIAVGNLRSHEAAGPLVEILTCENQTLRATAAWALGEISSTSAIQALNRALKHENDHLVLEEIRASLAKTNPGR